MILLIYSNIKDFENSSNFIPKKYFLKNSINKAIEQFNGFGINNNNSNEINQKLYNDNVDLNLNAKGICIWF